MTVKGKDMNLVKKIARTVFIIIFCNMAWIILDGSIISFDLSYGVTPVSRLFKYTEEQSSKSIPTSEVIKDRQWVMNYQLFASLLIHPMLCFAIGILAAWLHKDKNIVITYLSVLPFKAFLFLYSVGSIVRNIRYTGINLNNFHNFISISTCILLVYFAYKIVPQSGRNKKGTERKTGLGLEL